MSYLLTASGRRFYLNDIERNEIHVPDIGHGLANQCRFNGQCRQFYSVAQHSWHVAHLLPARLRMAGLLHDAAEAYLGDVIRPLKVLLPEYKSLENRVQDHILRSLGVPVGPEAALLVKGADEKMLATEMRDMMAAVDSGLPEPADFKIQPWSPEDSFHNFMWLYAELERRAVLFRGV